MGLSKQQALLHSCGPINTPPDPSWATLHAMQELGIVADRTPLKLHMDGLSITPPIQQHHPQCISLRLITSIAGVGRCSFGSNAGPKNIRMKSGLIVRPRHHPAMSKSANASVNSSTSAMAGGAWQEQRGIQESIMSMGHNQLEVN